MRKQKKPFAQEANGSWAPALRLKDQVETGPIHEPLPKQKDEAQKAFVRGVLMDHI